MEGRDSHFLSGPNLKKGQIQSNINHFKLCSFRSTIVIEQTSGKRPVAGGNKKPFDNHKVRFFPRSPQHLHKPKRAMSGCQHQSGHIYTPIFSQRDSYTLIHEYMYQRHRQLQEARKNNNDAATDCTEKQTQSQTDGRIHTLIFPKSKRTCKWCVELKQTLLK